MIDPKGSVTRYRYDRADRKIEEIRPLGDRTAYRYDAAGNLTEVASANGNTRRYSYDALNRRTREEHFLGQGAVAGSQPTSEANPYGNARPGTPASTASRIITYGYDAVGNLVSWSDAQAPTLAALDPAHPDHAASGPNAERLAGRFLYDALNRLTQSETTYRAGTPAAFTRSHRQSYTAAGRLLERVRQLDYDALGQLIEERRVTRERSAIGTEQVRSERERHTYNRRGNRIRTVAADGSEERCSYRRNDELIGCETLAASGASALAELKSGRERPDYSPCKYYGQKCRNDGCKYHCQAEGICTGSTSEGGLVNIYFSLCTALVRGSQPTDSELNCIRRCLVVQDAAHGGTGGCQAKCNKRCAGKNCIANYHMLCYTECKVPPNCYGGIVADAIYATPGLSLLSGVVTRFDPTDDDEGGPGGDCPCNR